MGIRFQCHHCEHELHVKDFQAGRRGRCPKCQGAFRIPLSDSPRSQAVVGASDEEATLEAQSASDANEGVPPAPDSKPQQELLTSPESDPPAALPEAVSDVTPDRSQSASEVSAHPEAWLPRVLAEAPTAKWFVRPESGGQFGPADGPTLLQWLSEQRIRRDSYLWREGWEQWQIAAVALDDFFESDSAQPAAIVQPTAGAEWDGQSASSPKPSRVEVTRDRRRRKKRRNHRLLLAGLSALAITLVIALIVVLWLQQQA